MRMTRLSLSMGRRSTDGLKMPCSGRYCGRRQPAVDVELSWSRGWTMGYHMMCSGWSPASCLPALQAAPRDRCLMRFGQPGAWGRPRARAFCACEKQEAR